MQHVVETIQIGVDHPIPIGLAQGREGRVTNDTGIADYPIVGAVLLNIGFQHGTAPRTVGDIELQQTPRATRSTDSFQRRFGTTLVAVIMHQDTKSIGRQFEGYGPANPLAGAGHQDATTHTCVLPNRVSSCSASGCMVLSRASATSSPSQRR